MCPEQINLIILTYTEWMDWKRSCQYEHDSAYFIKGTQVTEMLDMSKYRQIQVNSDMDVSEVIKEVRKSLPDYDKDFWEPLGWYKEESPNFKYKRSFSLYYPALSDAALSYTTKMSELGIKNLDIVAISTTLTLV